MGTHPTKPPLILTTSDPSLTNNTLIDSLNNGTLMLKSLINDTRPKRSTSNFHIFSFNPTTKPKNKKSRGPNLAATAAATRGNTNNNDIEIGVRSLTG